MNKTFEILIPVAPNKGEPTTDEMYAKLDFNKDGTIFNKAHHGTFIRKVLTVAGGYSWLPEIDGAWVNSHCEVVKEKMIPIRVACTDENIKEIASFAKQHYEQEAIFVLEIGTARFF